MGSRRRRVVIADQHTAVAIFSMIGRFTIMHRGTPCIDTWVAVEKRTSRLQMVLIAPLVKPHAMLRGTHQKATPCSCKTLNDMRCFEEPIGRPPFLGIINTITVGQDKQIGALDYVIMVQCENKRVETMQQIIDDLVAASEKQPALLCLIA